ncbi:MAG: pyridoxamine 5'-phosphate oxidase family protein [Candidatus Zixiibacteriota bacterium]
MRRKEKEITDRNQIENIIKRANICRIALTVDNEPYIVPVNFGYYKNALYFHSATEGKKIDMIRKNSRVCFEIDIDHELVLGKIACNGSMKYKSVIGWGTAEIIEDDNGKRNGLDIIMRQYADNDAFFYDDKSVERCIIIKVDIDSMTGKSSGD